MIRKTPKHSTISFLVFFLLFQRAFSQNQAVLQPAFPQSGFPQPGSPQPASPQPAPPQPAFPEPAFPQPESGDIGSPITQPVVP